MCKIGDWDWMGRRMSRPRRAHALRIAVDEASKEIISAKLWQLFGQIPELMEAQNVPLTLENPILWPVLCERILHKDAYCLQYGWVVRKEQELDWIAQRKRFSHRGQIASIVKTMCPSGPCQQIQSLWSWIFEQTEKKQWYFFWSGYTVQQIRQTCLFHSSSLCYFLVGQEQN